MKALVETDVHAFAERGLAWATREPAINTVLTTNAEAVRDGRRAYDDALWITVLDDSGVVVGAAMHTPPYYLFVCPMPADAAVAVAEALIPIRPDLAGVTGDIATAGEFVRAWQGLVGAGVRPSMGQRLYSLDTVTPPDAVPGQLRPARSADHDLLVEWTIAFLREAVPSDPHDDVEPLVRQIIDDGGAYFWDVDGSPVCYAAARRPAAGVARIGPVYTPPSERRRGYAGACVAAVSQRVLDAGATQCVLYTDLSNPTSNGVYQRLGYRPMSDSRQYAFTY